MTGPTKITNKPPIELNMSIEPDCLESLKIKYDQFALASTMEDKLDVAYEIYTKTSEVLGQPIKLDALEKGWLAQLQDAL
jgi:hypothetical protein